MSRIDPNLFPTTPEAKLAEKQGDAQYRLSILERGTGTPFSVSNTSISDATTTVKGKLKLAGHLSGTADTPIIATTAEPQISKLAFGAAADVQRTILDTVGGQAMNAVHGIPSTRRPIGRKWALAEGTAASPIAGEEATFKVDRAQEIVGPGQMEDAQWASAIVAVNRGGTADETMAVGVSGAGHQFSTAATRADACGLWGFGVMQAGTVTALGMGAYLEGRTLTTAGNCVGIETQAANWIASPTDSSFNPSGINHMSGIQIQNQVGNDGSKLGGVGILLYRNTTSGNGQFDVGFAVKSTNSPIRNSTIRDCCASAISLDIQGSHATHAIFVEQSAGNVNIGAASGAAARLTSKTATTTQKALQLQAISTSQSALMFAVIDPNTSAESFAVNHLGRTGIGTSSLGAMLTIVPPSNTVKTIVDQSTGAELEPFNGSTFSPPTASRWALAEGNSATPTSAPEKPTFKVDRWQNIAPGAGLEKAHRASIMGIASAGAADETMVIGVTAAAHSYSQAATRADACGLWAMGASQDASPSPGVGIGAYLEGKVKDPTVAYAHSLELQCRNTAAVAGDVNFSSTVGGNHMVGIYLLPVSTDATKTGGVGMVFARPNTSTVAQWDVGIGVTTTNTPIKSATIQDAGSAARSIYIAGAHATAAIEVTNAGGNISFGHGGGTSGARLKVKPDAAGGGAENCIQLIADSSQSVPMLVVYDTASVAKWAVNHIGRTGFGTTSLGNMLNLATATNQAGGIRFGDSATASNNAFLYRIGNGALQIDDSLTLGGTAGAGFFEIADQSSDPSTPSTGRARIWSKNVGGSDTALYFMDGAAYKGRLANVKAKAATIWTLAPQNMSAGLDKVNPATTTLSYTAIQVGNPCDITGLSFGPGTVAAGNVIMVILDAEGTYIATTSSTAVTNTGGNAWQDLALVGNPIKLRAIGTYYVGVLLSDITCRFRAYNFTGLTPPATGAEASYTVGNNITPSVTYTASQGPIVRTY